MLKFNVYFVKNKVFLVIKYVFCFLIGIDKYICNFCVYNWKGVFWRRLE